MCAKSSKISQRKYCNVVPYKEQSVFNMRTQINKKNKRYELMRQIHLFVVVFAGMSDLFHGIGYEIDYLMTGPYGKKKRR